MNNLTPQQLQLLQRVTNDSIEGLERLLKIMSDLVEVGSGGEAVQARYAVSIEEYNKRLEDLQATRDSLAFELEHNNLAGAKL